MNIIQTEIIKDGNLWQVEITNGNGLKVHIKGCETKAIAQERAGAWIDELKKAKLL